MPLTLPNAPAQSPSLSRPADFEGDNSAMLAWFKSLSDTMQGDSVLISSDIVGTVSQGGSTVMQRGSGPNGEYLRLADGTQICLVSVAAALTADTPAGQIYKSLTEYSWNFPAGFITGPVVYAGVRNSGAMWARGRPVSATNGAVALLSASSNAAAQSIDIAAIGRWF